jgi:hypothetical protein
MNSLQEISQNTYFNHLIPTLFIIKIQYCEFFNIHLDQGHGGGCYWDAADQSLNFVFNVIVGCHALNGFGGGIFIRGNSFTVDDNCFIQCSAKQGRGCYIGSNLAHSELAYCQFHKCESTAKEIEQYDSSLTFNMNYLFSQQSTTNVNFSCNIEASHPNLISATAMSLRTNADIYFNCFGIVDIHQTNVFYFILEKEVNCGFSQHSYINFTSNKPVFCINGKVSQFNFNQVYLSPNETKSYILWRSDQIAWKINEYTNSPPQIRQQNRINSE